MTIQTQLIVNCKSLFRSAKTTLRYLHVNVALSVQSTGFERQKSCPSISSWREDLYKQAI